MSAHGNREATAYRRACAGWGTPRGAMIAARATWRGVARARSRRSGARSLSPPLTNRSNSGHALDERLDQRNRSRLSLYTRRPRTVSVKDSRGRQPHTRGELHTRAQGYLGRAPSSPRGNGQADGVSHRRRSWAPEVLGHSNIAVALDTCNHAIPTMQETAVELVTGLVG
jgi:hypothetical protein